MTPLWYAFSGTDATETSFRKSEFKCPVTTEVLSGLCGSTRSFVERFCGFGVDVVGAEAPPLKEDAMVAAVKNGAMTKGRD